MIFKRNSLSARCAFLCVAICMFISLCLTGCGKTNGETQNPQTDNEQQSPDTGSGHKSETEKLIAIFDEQPEVKTLMEKSIAAAAEVNPDKGTNPVQSLEEYYDYLDWASTAMPWNISSNLPEESSLYEKIDQSLNYFYFLNDQPLEELDGKGLYNNSIQYAEPYRTWLIDFTRSWGEYLSTEDSWNDEYYGIAYSDEKFGLQGGWYEEMSGWNSFNDFFSRRLSTDSQRPVASPEDNSVVVSPADSTPQGVWQIDENSCIVQKEGVQIKSQDFNSVADLIGSESEYSEAFADGILTHTFLDVHDYHRYHFPVGGTIKEVRMIPGDVAVGGEVVWDAESQRYVLHADTPGWQMIETRACVIVETEEYGLVALLPIGMSQVSSVNFEDNIKVGETVEKGDMLGYFLFGGSDFVMVFQKDAGFEITAPMERDDEEYDHVLMGEEYGTLTGKALSEQTDTAA